MLALGSLCTRAPRAAAVARVPGSIEALVVCLGQPSGVCAPRDRVELETRFNAAFALGHLARCVPAAHEAMVAAGAVAPALALSTSEALHAATQAMSVLRRVSETPSVRPAVFGSTRAMDVFVVCAQTPHVELLRELACMAGWCTRDASVRELLAGHGGACGALFALALHADIDVARHAAGALANGCESASFRDALCGGLGEGVIGLVRVLRSRVAVVYREAARACANLLATPAAVPAFLDAKGLTCVLRVARLAEGSDAAVGYSAASMCRALVASAQATQALLARDGLAPLLALLAAAAAAADTVMQSPIASAAATAAPWPATRFQAACAVRDMCANPSLKLPLAERGLVAVAVALARDADVAMAAIGVACLRSLAMKAALGARMSGAGVTAAVVAALAVASEAAAAAPSSPAPPATVDPAVSAGSGASVAAAVVDVRWHGAGCLAELAERPPLHGRMVAEGAVSALVSLATTAHVSTIHAVASALASLTADPELVAAGALVFDDAAFGALCVRAYAYGFPVWAAQSTYAFPVWAIHSTCAYPVFAGTRWRRIRTHTRRCMRRWRSGTSRASCTTR